MKNFQAIIIGVLSFGISVSGSAQMVAKQGDFSVTNPTDFHSPMIIETVFAPAVDPSLWRENDGKKPPRWGKGAWFTVSEYHDMGKLTCDGLFLQQNYDNDHNAWGSALEMRVLEHENLTEVDLRITIRNPKYIHDKLATLKFEILNGNEPVAVATVTVKVKEDSENYNYGKMAFSKSVLKTAPPPTLRITMSTIDY